MNKTRKHISIIVLLVFLTPTVYQSVHSMRKHVVVCHDHCKKKDTEGQKSKELCDILMFHYTAMQTGFIFEAGEISHALISTVFNNYTEPLIFYQYSFKRLRAPPFC